ncbi:hypothetical protein Pla110_02810 [Polystyrenella longa]|uniref:Uncharacterized protein n=1 Tax=Polystyrenella longa TaxID=2528007 RepID=A0A518CH74_9PLAN|nr:hypothetical protein [Polystyrenella longa]QDU78577.1 hypothetical protein Pla110_02810 [Polystyrenella longa]
MVRRVCLTFLFMFAWGTALLLGTGLLKAEPPATPNPKEELFLSSGYLTPPHGSTHEFRLQVRLNEKGGSGSMQADENQCRVNLFGDITFSTAAYYPYRGINLKRVTDTTSPQHHLYEITYSTEESTNEDELELDLDEKKLRTSGVHQYLAVPTRDLGTYRLVFATEGTVDRIIRLERER